MVVCTKKQKQCCPEELAAGDCWIALSLADSSGLILAARVGKHTDASIEELVVSTEGKTSCKRWNSDGWGGYERVLPPEILHYIGKDKTQRLERTNGIVRQQTGRWLSLRHATRTTAEQIRQSVGANEGNRAISSELFQLDLAAQSLQNNSSSTSSTD